MTAVVHLNKIQIANIQYNLITKSLFILFLLMRRKKRKIFRNWKTIYFHIKATHQLIPIFNKYFRERLCSIYFVHMHLNLKPKKYKWIKITKIQAFKFLLLHLCLKTVTNRFIKLYKCLCREKNLNLWKNYKNN